jgi:hypothetical protein
LGLLDSPFAALPPSVGSSVVGKFLAVEGQSPVAQFNSVTGAQYVFGGRTAINPTAGPRTEVNVDVFVGRVTADLGVMLVKSNEAQVSVGGTADHGHSSDQVELPLFGVDFSVFAKSKQQTRSTPTAPIVRRRDLHDLLHPGTLIAGSLQLSGTTPNRYT